MKRASVAHILLAATLLLRSLPEVTGRWWFGVDMKFDCANGRFIPLQFMCNGQDDCGNNADENVCSPGLICPGGSFTCRNKMRCIPKRYVCDGDNDCDDAGDGVPSDEEDCATTTDVTTAAASAAKTPEPTTRMTPPLPTATVERAPTSTTLNTTPPPGRCNVDQGEFPCLDGRCLLPEQVCDARRDCSDGADEGRFCELVVGRGMRHHHHHQQQQQQQQQSHLEQSQRGWLVDFRMQFRMLFQPLLNSSQPLSTE